MRVEGSSKQGLLVGGSTRACGLQRWRDIFWSHELQALQTESSLFTTHSGEAAEVVSKRQDPTLWMRRPNDVPLGSTLCGFKGDKS